MIRPTLISSRDISTGLLALSVLVADLVVAGAAPATVSVVVSVKNTDKYNAIRMSKENQILDVFIVF